MMTKQFDCVEMKQKGAEEVYRKISSFTREEQLAFWSNGTKALKEIAEKSKRNRSDYPKDVSKDIFSVNELPPSTLFGKEKNDI